MKTKPIPNGLGKSIFLSLLIGFNVLVGLWSLTQLFEQVNLLSVGFLLQSWSPLAAIGSLFVFKRARTGRWFWPFSTSQIIGFLLVMGTNLPVLWSWKIFVSLLLIASWMLYLFWYSVFRSRNSPSIAVDAILPVVEFERIDGTPISTQTFLGRPTIYLFYRGNWCPLCMAQIREIVDQYEQLEHLGAQVVFISSQPQRQTQNLAKRFQLGFEFLVDRNGQAAKTLGIYAKNGLPAGLRYWVMIAIPLCQRSSSPMQRARSCLVIRPITID